ncbi:hypothetical protein L3Q82_024348 [Scortum barcoo]|uniref:Uncharacterized protein n=1 Tax=Scortum barcoo TaxID=214431 RepID=A0ACB8WUU7_9TELE|nr:hypothetical protein L3Q82_024348 [Scortum barcoo]
MQRIRNIIMMFSRLSKTQAVTGLTSKQADSWKNRNIFFLEIKRTTLESKPAESDLFFSKSESHRFLGGSPHPVHLCQSADSAQQEHVCLKVSIPSSAHFSSTQRLSVDSGAPPWSQAWGWGSRQAPGGIGFAHGTRPGSARNGNVGACLVGSPPPAGRSMRGRCNVVWVAVMAGSLDAPNPWTKTLAIGTWNVTSMGGKEPELLREVERHRTRDSRLEALEPSSLRGAGLDLHYSGVAQGGQGSLTSLRLRVGDRSLVAVVCAYGPNSSTEYLAFLESLGGYLIVLRLGTPLFYWGRLQRSRGQQQ